MTDPTKYERIYKDDPITNGEVEEEEFEDPMEDYPQEEEGII